MARQGLLDYFLTWRRNMQRFLKAHPEITPFSTNFLSLFGVPRAEVAAVFRSFPTRITPAQFLAGLLAVFLVLVELEGKGLLPFDDGKKGTPDDGTTNAAQQ